MSTPRGIERVVALASTSAALRERVLQDPLKAAEDAGLKLTDTERSILKSVPRQALEAMIKAAGAALLAAGLAGCDQLFGSIQTAGIAPDEPEPKPQAEDVTLQPLGGVRPDEPPEAHPDMTRTLLSPSTTGQIQSFTGKGGGIAPGGPVEDKP